MKRTNLPQPSEPFHRVLHMPRSQLLLVFAVGVLVGSSLICAALAIGAGLITLPH